MNQSNSTYSQTSPISTYSGAESLSTFTGKERDVETGYGYFGARYMDHELLTMWLSVDPMADKYPGISPYAYCAWNPVKLVDPDGREWDPSSLKIVDDYRKQLNNKLENAQTGYERKEIQAAIDELSVLDKSNQMYHVEYGEVSGYYKKGETGYDLKNNWVSMTIAYDGELSDVAHEMKHAYQFEVGELSFDSRTGGFGVLYDLTDERAAYDRSAVLGGKTVSNHTISFQQKTINKTLGGYIYPFLTSEDVKYPDVGQDRTHNKNSNNHNCLINNIFRRNGETFIW